MDTWDWIPFLRRRWRTIAITVLVVVVATLAVTLVLAPAFQSTATLAIQPLTLDNPLQTPSSAQLGAEAVGELVKSPNVMRLAARTLGRTPEALGASLDYRVIGKSNLVAITAETDNPLLAARIANAVAQAYIDENAAQLRSSSVQAQEMLQQKLSDQRLQIAELQRQLAQARKGGDSAGVAALQDQIGSMQAGYEQVLQAWQNLPSSQVALSTQVQIADAARPNMSPVRPRPSLNLILGLVGGIFIGLAIGSLQDSVESMRRRRGDTSGGLGKSLPGGD